MSHRNDWPVVEHQDPALPQLWSLVECVGSVFFEVKIEEWLRDGITKETWILINHYMWWVMLFLAPWFTPVLGALFAAWIGHHSVGGFPPVQCASRIRRRTFRWVAPPLATRSWGRLHKHVGSWRLSSLWSDCRPAYDTYINTHELVSLFMLHSCVSVYFLNHLFVYLMI